MLKHQKEGTDSEYHNSCTEKNKSDGDFKETSLRLNILGWALTNE